MPDSRCLVSTVLWLVDVLLLESEIYLLLFHQSTPLLRLEAVVYLSESVELWHLEVAASLT